MCDFNKLNYIIDKMLRLLQEWDFIESVNEYDIGNLNIKHYDLFRLTDNKELENIGLLENYNEHITLIEWPEKVKMVIDNKVSLFFEYGHDLEKRTINIKGLSEKKLNDIK